MQYGTMYCWFKFPETKSAIDPESGSRRSQRFLSVENLILDPGVLLQCVHQHPASRKRQTWRRQHQGQELTGKERQHRYCEKMCFIKGGDGDVIVHYVDYSLFRAPMSQ